MHSNLDNNAIGQRIREVRLSLGETTEDFAEHFNPKASKGTVSKWENGHYLPNNKRIKKIAELGKKSVTELLHGTIEEQVNSAIRMYTLVSGGSINVFVRDRIIRELINSGVTKVDNDYVLSEYNKKLSTESYSTENISLKNTIPDFVKKVPYEEDEICYHYDFILNAKLHGDRVEDPVKEELKIEYEGDAQLELTISPVNNRFRFIGLNLLYTGNHKNDYINQNDIDGIKEHLLQSVLKHHHNNLGLTFDDFSELTK